MKSGNIKRGIIRISKIELDIDSKRNICEEFTVKIKLHRLFL